MYDPSYSVIENYHCGSGILSLSVLRALFRNLLFVVQYWMTESRMPMTADHGRTKTKKSQSSTRKQEKRRMKSNKSQLHFFSEEQKHKQSR